jgi:hypothetical protein
MQTIETKYLPYTNCRGSRVKARSSGGHSVTVDWDYALNSEENHIAACKALVEKLQWQGTFQGGGTERGYVFTNMAANWLRVKGVK